jgi:hypothetical protein
MARTRLVAPEEDSEEIPETYPEPDEREIGDLAALSAADSGWHWQVHRLKSPDEIAKNRRGKERVWVTAITGAVDLQDFHARHGGGVYEFWGSVGGQLAKKVRLELDGVPKMPAPTDPTPITTTLTGNGSLSRGERALLRTIRRMEERIERISRTPVPMPPQHSIKDMIEGIVALDTLRQRAQPASDTGIARELFGAMSTALKQGIELGQSREPLPAGEPEPGWIKVLEVFGPIANRVLDQMAKRRPITPPVARPASPGPAAPTGEPAPVAQPPPPSGSSAVVVEDDEAAASISAARMMTVIDLLARAISEEDEIEDVADAIDRILPAGELAGILRIPEAAVVEDIAQRAGGQYPQLATPDGRAYVALVLSELKREPEADPAS